MALYDKKLRYKKTGDDTGIITLYTENGEEVPAPALHVKQNADNIENIMLYDDVNDVAYDGDALMYLDDAVSRVYAPLVSANSELASDVSVKVNDKVYRVALGKNLADVVAVQKEKAYAKADELGIPHDLRTITDYELVRRAVKAGIHDKLWDVGDYMPITINSEKWVRQRVADDATGDGQPAGQYKAQVIGFNHNKDIETHGENSITFMIVSAQNESPRLSSDRGAMPIEMYDNFTTNNAEAITIMDAQGWVTGRQWNNFTFRTKYLPRFYSCIDDSLKPYIANTVKWSDRFTDEVAALSPTQYLADATVIPSTEEPDGKEVTCYGRTGYNLPNALVRTEDKLFCLSILEVFSPEWLYDSRYVRWAATVNQKQQWYASYIYYNHALSNYVKQYDYFKQTNGVPNSPGAGRDVGFFCGTSANNSPTPPVYHSMAYLGADTNYNFTNDPSYLNRLNYYPSDGRYNPAGIGADCVAFTFM